MPEQMTPEERQKFISHVAELSKKLDVSEKQRLKTEKLAKDSHTTSQRVKWVLVGMAVLFAVGAYYISEQRSDGKDLKEAQAQIKDQQKIIEDVQLQTCQNANQTREGQIILWDFVIEVNLNEQNITAQERAYLHEIKTFIHDLFQVRDCSDLNREYPLPEPPAIIEMQGEEGEI